MIQPKFCMQHVRYKLKLKIISLERLTQAFPGVIFAKLLVVFG